MLGVDEEGSEVLTYLEGDSVPLGWAKVIDDAGLTRFARLLRDGIEQVRRLANAGHQPQVGWVANGLLEELANRLAWSQATRHLFE